VDTASLLPSLIEVKMDEDLDTVVRNIGYYVSMKQYKKGSIV
jgi:hypothetical protein